MRIYVLTIVSLIVFSLSTVYAADYTITISDEDLPYIQERAGEESLSIPQLLNALIKGVANSQIAKKYQNEILRTKTAAEMKAELIAIGK